MDEDQSVAYTGLVLGCSGLAVIGIVFLILGLIAMVLLITII